MLKNIVIGIKAYTGAFKLISNLKLWKYFAIPIIISVLTAVIIGVSAYGLSDNIGQYISKLWIWDWGFEAFEVVGNVIGGLVVITLGLVLYKHIIMALSAPFMSPVSEKIEIHLTGHSNHNHRDTTFSQQLWRGIRINIRNLGMELLLTIPILLLNFVPIIGFFTTLLLFIVQAYYAGFGNMDYTLERHFKYQESIQFVRKHRGLAIGNGIVFILFLLIPILGVILVLPLSVTAAAKNTIETMNSNTNNR